MRPCEAVWGALGQSGFEDWVGGSSHEVLLGVCTWQHFWLRDWGVGGKKDYLEAWWESIDWNVVEKNGNFDNAVLKRYGKGLPGGDGKAV